MSALKSQVNPRSAEFRANAEYEQRLTTFFRSALR